MNKVCVSFIEIQVHVFVSHLLLKMLPSFNLNDTIDLLGKQKIWKRKLEKLGRNFLQKPDLTLTVSHQVSELFSKFQQMGLQQRRINILTQNVQSILYSIWANSKLVETEVLRKRVKIRQGEYFAFYSMCIFDLQVHHLW